MNIALKRVMFSVCAIMMFLCVFSFFGCGGNEDFNESDFGLNDKGDVVLLLDVDGRNFVDLSNLKDCEIKFDENILNLKDNKLVAVKEGSSKVEFFVEWKEKTYTKTQIVSVVKPVFCGDVEIENKFVYSLEGKSKKLEFKNLNNGYSFETTYRTDSKHFSVDKNGLLTPISEGSGAVEISFVSGINERGEYIYKTLQTIVNIIKKSSVQVSVFDENKYIISSATNDYVLLSNPRGKIYYFKYYLSEEYEIANVQVEEKSEENIISDQKLVNLNSNILENGFQKFALYDAGKSEFCLQLKIECFNHTTTIKSVPFKFEIYREISDIIANVKSSVYDDKIADANQFNLYVINEKYSAEARQDKIYDSLYVEFDTNEHTNEILSVVVVDAQDNVLFKDGGFVVNANHVGTVTFLVSAISGYSEEFSFVIKKLNPTSITFAFENKTDLTVNLDEELNLTPTIAPSYSVYEINYVYENDNFEIIGGVLYPFNPGTQTLTIETGGISKTYSITVQNNKIQIFETHTISDNPYCASFSYRVAKQNTIEDAANYNQNIVLKFYDGNHNLLEDLSNILCVQNANSFDVYLAPGFTCFVEIYSSTYSISSNLVWLQN